MCNRIFLSLFFAITTALLAEDAAPGKQVEQKLDLGNGISIEFLLYLPEDYDGEKQLPFMLFLHDREESMGPLSLVKQWGPPRIIERGDKMPYVVASPQCPASASWSQAGEQAKLVRLLAYLEDTYAIDQGRMYLTGFSMGGSGSWALMATHPDKFAAVAPICGKGHPADAEKLKDVPIWAWHGLNDRVIPPSGSEEIVARIQKAGGTKVIYTSLEGIGHNVWSSAYATPELYSWFNRQSLTIDEE